MSCAISSRGAPKQKIARRRGKLFRGAVLPFLRSHWVLQGDVLDTLKSLPAQCAQCVVTSPPYFGLRDYGLEPVVWDEVSYSTIGGVVEVPPMVACLGLEPAPEAYVGHLVAVFREVNRVLRDDGVLWLNIGDSYAGSWGNQGRKAKRGTQRSINGPMMTPVSDGRYPDVGSKTGTIPPGVNYKAKDLLGIPWMVAFTLRADGWYLRSEVIWEKPNVMPSSVRDRCTNSHEQVFMLTKSKKYHYDQVAVMEEAVGKTPHDLSGQGYSAPGQTSQNGNRGSAPTSALRNKRDVWSIATQAFPEAHFAVFPPKLVEPMVLAGTSPRACGTCGTPWRRNVERTAMVVREGPSRQEARDASANGSSGERLRVSGTMLKAPTTTTTGFEPACECEDPSNSQCVVLDPFCGSGTTGMVARQLGQRFIGIEASERFCEMAQRRIVS